MRKVYIVDLPFEAKTASKSRERYAEAARLLGVPYESIQLDSSESLNRIKLGDIFVCRWADSQYHKTIYASLVPHLEQMGILTIPRYSDLALLDNKAAVELAFRRNEVKRPKTTIYYSPSALEMDLDKYNYPVILKENEGASSSGVHMANSPESLRHLFKAKFYKNKSLYDHRDFFYPKRWKKYLRSLAKHIISSGKFRFLLSDKYWHPLGLAAPLVVQEFIPKQEHDIRVTVIGERAFFFRRANRKGDFRASGSGNILYNQDNAWKYIDKAFKIAGDMKLHTAAFDFLESNSDLFAIEVSPQFDPEAIHNCPGYWQRDGAFISGAIWPEICELEDIIARG